MKATLLSVYEISPDELKNKVKATDFAIATGVIVNDEGYAPYYLKSSYNGCVHAVRSDGRLYLSKTRKRAIGVRPVLEFSSMDEIFESGGEILEGNKLKFGMYALTSLSKDEQIELTNKIDNGVLKRCGEHVIDLVNNIKTPIYENDGKKVICIKACSEYSSKEFELSKKEIYKGQDYIWLEVKDVIWNFDEENLKAISEDVLIGGIQFDNDCYYYDEDYFDEMGMYKYLNYVFLPELLQFQNKKLDKQVENKDECKQLLSKIKDQQEYIKYLEEELKKNKQFLDEVNASLEGVVNQINKSNIYKPQN